MNLFDLSGKTAIITGTSGNLGPIWKETLEQMGIKVFGIDLPKYDLSNPDDISKAVFDYKKEFSTPDIIICNAGLDNPPGSDANFWGSKKIMNVNFYGHKFLIKFLWDDLKEKDGLKHIIFIGSLLGNVAADHRNYTPPFDKPVDYGASKRALFALTQNLATRGAPYNILVNMLSFAAVQGNQSEDFKQKYLKNVPMGRMATKDDCQRALMGMLIQTYLIGKEILFDGGYTAW